MLYVVDTKCVQSFGEGHGFEGLWGAFFDESLAPKITPACGGLASLGLRDTRLLFDIPLGALILSSSRGGNTIGTGHVVPVWQPRKP